MNRAARIKAFKTYLVTIVLVEAAGVAVALLTRSGTQLYATSVIKPPLSPPALLFPVVWTILYALLAIGLARILLAEPSPGQSWSVVLFAFQIAFNLAWPFIFFADKSYGLALIELLSMLVEAVAMMLAFNMADHLAARLQIPYLVWLCFAAYLNAGVLLLN